MKTTQNWLFALLYSLHHVVGGEGRHLKLQGLSTKIIDSSLDSARIAQFGAAHKVQIYKEGIKKFMGVGVSNFWVRFASVTLWGTRCIRKFRGGSHKIWRWLETWKILTFEQLKNVESRNHIYGSKTFSPTL